MKWANVICPWYTIHAKAIVAMVLSEPEMMMIGFFFSRSAMTPPRSEKNREGAMKDSITQVRSMAEPVMSYISHPRAMICMFIANKPAMPLNQIKRKSLKNKDANIPLIELLLDPSRSSLTLRFTNNIQSYFVSNEWGLDAFWWFGRSRPYSLPNPMMY